MIDTEKRPSNATGIWRLCLTQARLFIEAAELIAEADNFAHIVYHLSLLALEEIGKGNMVGALAVSKRDSAWGEKALESHARKLQWALWTPMNRINQKDFSDAGVQANDLHERRLSSLYVDPNRDATELSQKEKISVASAKSWLNVARARLNLEVSHGFPTEEADELLTWFLDTMASENQAKGYLLSKSFTAKYEEMSGDARSWATWAREEIERIEREDAEILRAELTRKPATDGERKLRWRARATVFTPSHSIRPKILNLWNNRLGKVVELVNTGKKDSFDLKVIFTIIQAYLDCFHERVIWLSSPLRASTWEVLAISGSSVPVTSSNFSSI